MWPTSEKLCTTFLQKIIPYFLSVFGLAHRYLYMAIYHIYGITLINCFDVINNNNKKYTLTSYYVIKNSYNNTIYIQTKS